MDPEVQILPRTFEANQHPKGSQERACLEKEAAIELPCIRMQLSSLYQPSCVLLLLLKTRGTV